MSLLSRRSLLALGLAVPALIPGQAFAAIPLPLKQRNQHAQPLGTWRIINPNPEVDAGDPITIALGFRPFVDVEAPVMRFWIPRWNIPAPKGSKSCAPSNLSNTVDPPPGPLTHNIATVINLDLTTRQPPKPNNVYNGELLSERQRNQIAGQTRPIRKRAYRVFVDIADPVTCRRALFDFNLWLRDDYPSL